MTALLCAFSASVALPAEKIDFNKHFGYMGKSSDGCVDQSEWNKAFPKTWTSSPGGRQHGRQGEPRRVACVKKNKGIKDEHK
jgi:hypothetical protein